MCIVQYNSVIYIVNDYTCIEMCRKCFNGEECVFVFRGGGGCGYWPGDQ